jgi:polyisoprenoid-binding protein YceI
MLHHTRHHTASRRAILTALFLLAASLPAASQDPGVPVFKISPQTGSIKFFVSSSVAIEGKFDKWDATLVFASADPATGVLDIKIQAASVDTGSGFKNSKLKGGDFFDVANSPLITFHSTKLTQTGTNTFDLTGDFTIRGVTKPETLSLVVTGIGTGTGTITGKMAFDRKDYGVNGDIPFIKIADRVEVNVNIAGVRTSGPPIALKK